MWNDRKSLVLSKICVGMFMAILVIGVIFLPSLITRSLVIDFSPVQELYFRVTLYAGALPASAVLVLLYLLLRNIGKGELFVKRNVDFLRYISWCCYAGALICLVSSYSWLAWFALGVAAAFMGLIVRVIKNVFAKAVSLQDDADLTV